MNQSELLAAIRALHLPSASRDVGAVRETLHLVRDVRYPEIAEPPIGAYWKKNTIQPVIVIAGSSGITSMDSLVKTGVSTSAVCVVASTTPVVSATLRVRSVGTGGYVAIGGVAGQHLQLTSGAAVDLWCSDLDQVYVKTDSGNTAVVEVIYGY